MAIKRVSKRRTVTAKKPARKRAVPKGRVVSGVSAYRWVSSTKKTSKRKK